MRRIPPRLLHGCGGPPPPVGGMGLAHVEKLEREARQHRTVVDDAAGYHHCRQRYQPEPEQTATTFRYARINARMEKGLDRSNPLPPSGELVGWIRFPTCSAFTNP